MGAGEWFALIMLVATAVGVGFAHLSALSWNAEQLKKGSDYWGVPDWYVRWKGDEVLALAVEARKARKRAADTRLRQENVERFERAKRAEEEAKEQELRAYERYTRGGEA